MSGGPFEFRLRSMTNLVMIKRVVSGELGAVELGPKSAFLSGKTALGRV